MSLDTVFQNILDAHFPPPKWVRELDDLTPLPPIGINDPEYGPYYKKGERDEPISDWCED